jgi:hypothetical protein
MAVVPLTLTISLCLVFTFVIFFLREHARGAVSSAERDSLLPLAEEDPRPARRTPDEDDHAHSHEANCGCHDGSRQPCPGCLKRR